VITTLGRLSGNLPPNDGQQVLALTRLRRRRRIAGVDGASRQTTIRTALPLVSAIVLLDVLFYSAIAPMLPTYVASFHLSTAEAGLLSGSYALGILIASMPAGWLATRGGTRLTLLLGLGLLGAASIAFGLGQTFWILTTARFLQGVGGAASWAAGLAWLIDVAPRDKRGELLGAVLGIGIAGAIGGPVLGAVAVALGPARVFPAIAVVAAALAIPIAVTAIGNEHPSGGDIGKILRDRRVLTGAWLTTLTAIFLGTYAVLVPLRLSELGASAAKIAVVFLIAAAIEAGLCPLVGRLSDRRGRLLPVRIGLVGMIVASSVVPRPQLVWVVGAAMVLAGAAGGLLYTPASALLSDGAQDAALPQAFVFALYNMVWAVGQVGGTIGGARLADATNDTVPYLVVTALAMASVLTLGRATNRASGQSHIGPLRP
jgi:MFS family permease